MRKRKKKLDEEKKEIENNYNAIKKKFELEQKKLLDLDKNFYQYKTDIKAKDAKEKEKEIEKHINNNNDTKNSIDGNLNDDLNELKEKNKGLEEENILLRQELENEKAKNKEQNEDNGNEIKGGKYNLFVSYVTQLLNEMKPNEGKEKYLYNKLKRRKREKKKTRIRISRKE